jgi:hypothetical protein
MKLHHHTAASTLIAAALYLTCKSWALAGACFISGIFIDLDHILDVTREHGFSRIHHIFRICNNGQFTRIYLVWHGWEWVLLSGAAAWFSGWNHWVTGMFIGISQHILLDALYNSSGFLSYSLLWRWKKNFEFDAIFPSLSTVKYRYR